MSDTLRWIGQPVRTRRAIHRWSYKLPAGTVGIVLWADTYRRRACVVWDGVGQRHDVPLEVLERVRVLEVEPEVLDE
jgi:hypothetical protein